MTLTAAAAPHRRTIFTVEGDVAVPITVEVVDDTVTQIADVAIQRQHSYPTREHPIIAGSDLPPRDVGVVDTGDAMKELHRRADAALTQATSAFTATDGVDRFDALVLADAVGRPIWLTREPTMEIRRAHVARHRSSRHRPLRSAMTRAALITSVALSSPLVAVICWLAATRWW